MIKVTVEYLIEEKELEIELVIMSQVYTDICKEKNPTNEEIIRIALLLGAKYDIKRKINREAHIDINNLVNYGIIDEEKANELRESIK